jgi:hypothetical protein
MTARYDAGGEAEMQVVTSSVGWHLLVSKQVQGAQKGEGHMLQDNMLQHFQQSCSTGGDLAWIC